MSETPSYLRLDWCPACGEARLLLRGTELRCSGCKRSFPENISRLGGAQDLLSTLGESGTIMEVLGVQVAMSFVRLGPVVPGSTHKLTIAVQNCWNAERRLGGALHPAGYGGRLFGGGTVELARTPAITLGPLEVGRLSLRLRLPERAANRYRIVGRFSVDGSGGQRRIFTERPALVPRSSGIESFVAAILHVLDDHHHHHSHGSRTQYSVEFNVDTSGSPVGIEVPPEEYERLDSGSANVR